MPDKREKQQFARWMADVDRLVQERFQISVHDLPDMQFRHSFDNGVTPQEFLPEVIELIRAEFGYEAVDGGDDD